MQNDFCIVKSSFLYIYKSVKICGLFFCLLLLRRSSVAESISYSFYLPLYCFNINAFGIIKENKKYESKLDRDKKNIRI